MKNWLTRQFVHQRWSNLYYFGLLGVFLSVQWFSPSSLVVLFMCALLFIIAAPHRYNIGDKIVAWERRRYPL